MSDKGDESTTETVPDSRTNGDRIGNVVPNTTPEQTPGAVAEDAGRDVAAISSNDLRALLAKATPGDWVWRRRDLPDEPYWGDLISGDNVVLRLPSFYRMSDAALIALTPQLAAEVLARRAPSAPVKVAGLDVNLLHRMRTRSSWQDCKAGADALESCHAASAVKDAEIARLTAQAENDAETMRGVRKWLMEGDPSRALLWINDGLSGYTDTAENTLSEAIARAERAEAALAAGLEACDDFDGPVSKSAFVNGQSTCAQQIRAKLKGEA